MEQCWGGVSSYGPSVAVAGLPSPIPAVAVWPAHSDVHRAPDQGRGLPTLPFAPATHRPQESGKFPTCFVRFWWGFRPLPLCGRCLPLEVMLQFALPKSVAVECWFVGREIIV